MRKKQPKVSDACLEGLIPSDTLKKSKITLERFPASHRFQSLTEKEIQRCPWISAQNQVNMSDMVVPEKPEPKVIQPPVLRSDEELTEVENDPNARTPDDYVSLLDSGKDHTCESLPIVDLAAKKAQINTNDLSFPYTKRPFPVKFLQLNGLKMENGRVTGGLDMFVWVDKPVTETVHFDIKQGKDKQTIVEITSFKRKFESLMLPFVADPNAILVMVLFVNNSSKGDSDVWGMRPATIGTKKILSQEGICWRTFEPGVPFQDYLKPDAENTHKKLNHIDLDVDCNVLDEGTPDRTCRLTAADPMFPSPLLTIFDLRLELAKKMVSKKKAEVFIGVTLKCFNPETKKEEPIKAAISSRGNKKTDFCYTSPVYSAEKSCFLEPLHFILHKEYKSPVTLVINVFKLKKGKAKLMLTGTEQITRAYEMHRVKMEQKGGLLSKGDAFVRFNTVYPAVCAPTPAMRPAMSGVGEVDTHDPMYSSVAPYIVQQHISMKKLPTVNFELLFNCFMAADVSLQNWIEHYFTPEPGFAAAFIKRLVASMNIIESLPMPFFELAFKSLIVECDEKEKDKRVLPVEPILDLLHAVAVKNVKTLLKSAADLLCQLRMYFRPKEVHLVCYKFIQQLATKERFFIFNHLVSDMGFIQSLSLRAWDLEDRPISAYVPILSLFFSTLTNCFMENQKETLSAGVRTLQLLTTTLELYAEEELSMMSAYFFPLLPIIFTFWDSISTELKDMSLIAPVLLFIMKYTSRKQILNYFTSKVLSYDNQTRFFDFLIKLGEPSVTQKLSETLDSMTPLSTSLEVTWRITHFIKFLLYSEDSDVKIVKSAFYLLGVLLNAANQPKESLSLIFSTMAMFVSKYEKMIFESQTSIIVHIINDVINITQRKMIDSRNEAIGFLLWLMKLEAKRRVNRARCDIALQFSICNVFFEKRDNFITFWQYLPPGVEKAGILFNKLDKAMKVSDLYENQLIALLDIYEEFKDFPSIRAKLYAFMVELNKANEDYPAAFIAQWKLSALIAEVFRLKKEKILGIPPTGMAAFKFIVNEPPVDISGWEKDSAYLVMESKLFNEEYLSQSLQEAMALCQRAGMHWLIGDVTEILFDYLEKQRQFSLLKTLYERVMTSFASLQVDEHSQVKFCRIFVAGPSSDRLQYTDVLRVLPYQGEQAIQEYIMKRLSKLLVKVRNIPVNNQPIFQSQTGICQMISVKCDPEEIANLNVRNFTMFFLGKDQGWDKPLVQKYTFVAASPLPACVSLVKVASHTVTDITKTDYFETKLKRFRDNYIKVVNNIEAVLPPPHMVKAWSNSVIGLSATPILRQMSKIFKTEKPEEHPYYILARKLIVGEKEPDVPDRIRNVIHEIRNLLVGSTHVISAASKVSSLLPPEAADLQEFRKSLGLPCQ